jgi:hypothetical protein
MMALLVVLGLLIAALVTLAITNRVTNTQNANLIEQIEDCTTTDGDCYKRGQQRTSGAIVEVVRAQVLIELCGQDPDNDTAAELQRCVAAKSEMPR